MKTSYSKKCGNPNGNEMTAVLVKNAKGNVEPYIFISPEWADENNQRKVYSDFMGRDVPLQWFLGSHRPSLDDTGEMYRNPPSLHVGDREIHFFSVPSLHSLQIDKIVFLPSPDGMDCYDELPGIIIEKSS